MTASHSAGGVSSGRGAETGAAATLDAVQLRNLRVTAVVGALPAERTAPQPLEIDIDVYGDFSRAAETDNLADAVNYAEVADLAVRLATDTGAVLLEHLASEIAVATAALGGVSGATVTVRKLRPPVPHDLGTAAARVTRWAA